MRRSHSILVSALLFAAAVFSWPQSRAHDDSKTDSTNRQVSEISQADLLERIVMLEQRLARLESEKSLVQQADNRETASEPAPRPLPAIVPTEKVNPPKKTNGTTWRIRMLSHRSSANRTNE